MANVSVLCEETLWPIATGHADKLVIMHGLETSERPGDVLEEASRVLGPGGRAVFIVPHRSGMWSRSDQTPFGYGRPYSTGQLEGLLKQHGFMPERHRATLYQPPSHKRFWRKAGRMLESFGKTISPVMAGGVLIVEASKRVQAPSGPGMRVRVKRPLGVLSPSPEVAPA